MKKNLVRCENVSSQVRGLVNCQRDVQKYLSLEDHPRRKQRTVDAFNYPASVVALMF